MTATDKPFTIESFDVDPPTPGDFTRAVYDRPAGDRDDDERLHVPKGGHEALSKEVRDYIERRIRELNAPRPGDNRPVCDQCVVNIAADVILEQAIVTSNAGDLTSSMLLARQIGANVKFLEHTRQRLEQKAVGRDPKVMLDLLIDLLRGKPLST